MPCCKGQRELTQFAIKCWVLFTIMPSRTNRISYFSIHLQINWSLTRPLLVLKGIQQPERRNIFLIRVILTSKSQNLSCIQCAYFLYNVKSSTFNFTYAKKNQTYKWILLTSSILVILFLEKFTSSWNNQVKYIKKLKKYNV